MKKLLLIFIPSGILILVSCATLPKETVDMSKLLQKQITTLEKVGLEMASCCVENDTTAESRLLFEEVGFQFELAKLMNETITENIESFYEVRAKRKVLFGLWQGLKGKGVKR